MGLLYKELNSSVILLAAFEQFLYRNMFECNCLTSLGSLSKLLLLHVLPAQLNSEMALGVLGSLVLGIDYILACFHLVGSLATPHDALMIFKIILVLRLTYITDHRICNIISTRRSIFIPIEDFCVFLHHKQGIIIIFLTSPFSRLKSVHSKPV